MEERISTFEDRSVEITQSKEQKEKKTRLVYSFRDRLRHCQEYHMHNRSLSLRRERGTKNMYRND